MNITVPAEAPKVFGLEYHLDTPENVPLVFALAGPAGRFGAYVVDLAIQVAAFVAAVFMFSIAGLVLPSLSTGLLLLFMFALQWGYFVFWEYFWRGTTPGKRAFGLRVVQENGYPLTWWSSLTRNLLRVADILPLPLMFQGLGPLAMLPLYGPGLVAMVVSGRHQRIGDLAANTLVIQERRSQLPHEPLILDRIRPLERHTPTGFRPDSRTLALIDRFLGRRHVLSHARGHALASTFALVLARRLGIDADDPDVAKYPMAFLARVYVTFTNPEAEMKATSGPGRTTDERVATAPSVDAVEIAPAETDPEDAEVADENAGDLGDDAVRDDAGGRSV